MRLFGAGLIWLTVTLTGLEIFRIFKWRYQISEGILFMIEVFSSSINFLMKPTDEIICELNNSAVQHNLPFISLCLKNIYNGTDFPVAWAKAVKAAEIPLKKSEKNKLINFGCSLGKADARAQEGIIKIYYEYFYDLNKKAKASYEKYSASALTVCFFLGFALFLYLL